MASVLEFALSEWGLNPDWILTHWTEEQLLLYVLKHNSRIHREEHPEDSPSMTLSQSRQNQRARFEAWKQLNGDSPAQP